MALTKEEWRKSYEHRFDKRKYKVKTDIFGNKLYPKNKPRHIPLKTPDWILKGGSLPKNIIYDEHTDTYKRIRKVYKKRGYKTKKKRLGGLKSSS